MKYKCHISLCTKVVFFVICLLNIILCWKCLLTSTCKTIYKIIKQLKVYTKFVTSLILLFFFLVP